MGFRTSNLKILLQRNPQTRVAIVNAYDSFHSETKITILLIIKLKKPLIYFIIDACQNIMNY